MRKDIRRGSTVIFFVMLVSLPFFIKYERFDSFVTALSIVNTFFFGSIAVVYHHTEMKEKESEIERS